MKMMTTNWLTLLVWHWCQKEVWSWTKTDHGRSEGNTVRPILSSVTDLWDGRSKTSTEDQSGLSDLSRRKTKQTPRWIVYQLD